MSEDKRLERIEAKIDDLNDHLGSIDVTLGQQHISLKEHIRRTSILEDEFKPIKKHVNMVEGGFKLLGILASVAAVFECAKVYFNL